MAVAGAPLVLVTGISGYIASHVAQQLLKTNEVRVRGTMRSLKDEARIKALKDMVPDTRYQLELVEAELQNEDSWKEAVKGCEYVYHLASPFPLEIPRDENEIIQPAVAGALNVLKACSEAGTVKRVVLTSSIAAISAGLNVQSGRLYTEEDWAPEEDCAPYEKSKLKAERAAWDFMEKLSEEKKFEFVVINPAVVIGPSVGPSKGASSAEVVKAILANEAPALARVHFPLVDVRDVAAGHIAAMNKPGAAGNRYILYDRSLWSKEVAEIISKEFAPQGYKIKSWIMPKAGIWLSKFFFAPAKLIYPALGKTVIFQNDKMKTELGIHPMDLSQSVIDTCYSLIENGVVRKTPGYQAPSSMKSSDSSKLEAKAEPKKESSDEDKGKDKNKNHGGIVFVPVQNEKDADQSKTSEVPTATQDQSEEMESRTVPAVAQDQRIGTELEQTPAETYNQMDEVVPESTIVPVDCKDGAQPEDSPTAD